MTTETNQARFTDPDNYRNMQGSGMLFTKNKGQIIDTDKNPRPDVLYKGEGAGADIYLRKTGISYVYSNMAEIMREVGKQMEELEVTGSLKQEDKQKKEEELKQKHILKIHRVDMNFVRALSTEAGTLSPSAALRAGRVEVSAQAGNNNTQIIEEDKADGTLNYYYPHCPQGITDVKQYNKVTLKNIYNNIDVRYYGSNKKGLKYDIIVNPHADPDQIQLQWTGAENISINHEGNLVIKTSVNEFYESIPKVYQVINGEVIDVKARYDLKGTTVNLELGAWNPEHSLIIDPATWITYYGGAAGGEQTNAIATDPSGNVIFTGERPGADFPVSAGAFQTTFANGTGFLVKMNANGTRQFGTFISVQAADVATDGLGNIYVAGSAGSGGAPTGATPGNFVHKTSNGSNGVEAFLMKFDPAGARLWSTYYGGEGQDDGLALTTFGNNVYLYGDTRSISGIASPGAFQAIKPGTTTSQVLFIAKFLSNGICQWGTYLGGSGGDVPGSIACDPSGNIYVCGDTWSTDFPVLAGFQMIHSPGFGDAFLFKLNPAGGRIWGTYYGGTDGTGMQGERITDVTTDGSGNVILIGVTGSLAGIASPGAFQPNYGGTCGGFPGDIFIVKFNSSGTRQWATYMGGNRCEIPAEVAVDKNNNIYIFGEFEDADAGNYPISVCAYQSTALKSGKDNDFIARYAPDGIQTCITYMSGAEEDEAIEFTPMGGMAIYNNYLYITGQTYGGYPVTPGAFQTTFAGVQSQGPPDAFVAQLCINICEAKVSDLNFTSSTTSACLNKPVTFTPSVGTTCDTSGYIFNWTFTGGNPASSTAMNPIVTYPAPGNYAVKLTLTTTCKKDSITKTNYITITPPCGMAAVPTGASTCSGICTTISSIGTNGTPPYLYNWSTGQTTQTINVCPFVNTNYTVTVTDFAGSTSTVIVPVKINTPPQASIFTSTPATCGNISSTSTIVPTGGTPGYFYLWSNGQTTPTATGLVSGTYSVTVTDAKGCTTIATILNTPAPISLPVLTLTSSPKTCMPNGRAKATATGSPAFSYSWSNGAGGDSIYGLATGTYSVTVRDKNGCTSSNSVNVTQGPPPPSSFTISPNKTLCLGATVTFTNTSGLSGGSWQLYNNTPPSNFNTSANTDNFTYTFNNPPGTGTFFIRHTTVLNGCASTTNDTIVIVNCLPGKPGIAALGGGCFPAGNCNKSLLATAAGGSSPYTYSWSTGATTSKIAPCPSVNTTYTVTVTDAAGITNTTTAALIIGPSASFTKSPAGTICAGATVNFTGGTYGGATYSWTIGTPANVSGTTSNFSYTFLNAGNYVVTLSAGNGTCGDFVTDTVKVIDCSAAPIVIATGSSVCSGTCAAITSTPVGGTPPYIYAWNNGSTTQNINPCPAITTTYTLTITDAGGKTATTTATIIVSSPLIGQFTKGTAVCATCGCKEWLMVNATGGTSPYSYTWPDGYDKRYKNKLCPGSYTINIKDKNGCTIAVNVSAP